jgi:hypothetical protein
MLVMYQYDFLSMVNVSEQNSFNGNARSKAQCHRPIPPWNPSLLPKLLKHKHYTCRPHVPLVLQHRPASCPTFNRHSQSTEKASNQQQLYLAQIKPESNIHDIKWKPFSFPTTTIKLPFLMYKLSELLWLC